MASHAFQFLVTDADVRDSLTAIRRALVPGGRFVFETRNLTTRAWEGWDSMAPMKVVDPAGREIQISYDVHGVTSAGVVTLDEVTSDGDGRRLRADQGQLRFLSAVEVGQFLDEAGFVIDAQYGTWERGPLTADSDEIITVARRPA